MQGYLRSFAVDILITLVTLITFVTLVAAVVQAQPSQIDSGSRLAFELLPAAPSQLDQPTVLLGRAQQRLELGDHQAAIDDLRRLLALDGIDDPSDPATIDPTTIDALILLGSALADVGEIYEARACFEMAAELTPSNAEVWVLLGSVEQELGNGRSARRAYESYLALEPSGRVSDDLRHILSGL